ncbi:hypothetical protein GcLGCM259_0380 [Glutamicibacter creatinolyticus]|uniref:HTH tetR-type domain-containing protein n=1 Tax=Glutamicibacter creatinolyticus TaxID=162496 RepID=A0A5B7WQ21_9MICC|nr:TetR/AcrR family transcriptional regulator [Glutamicibacter creatinolyticus]QCY46161.1 hypothetical protein GcLGCM259_0380 [Glutamicibacter creatinolyticus]
MTGEAVGRPRVRATDSKERLFAASMTLLGHRGINAVSVDEIARAAGVSKGTVYYNFGSKDSMIGALLAFGADILLEELEQYAEQSDGLQALEAMVVSAFRFVERYPSYAQLWISEQQRSESLWGEQLSDFREQITALIRQVLRRTVQVPEPLLQVAASAMFGATLLTARERAVTTPMPPLEVYVQAVLATVHGLERAAAG